MKKLQRELRVLLVDDDSNIRRTLALSLKDLRCQVEQAATVEVAMSLVRDRPFDLILTDYKMEKQTGLDLIQQTRALRPDAVIVVMTAFASFENAVTVIKEGAFDYLPKPFSSAQLEQLLLRVRIVAELRDENHELRSHQVRRDTFVGFTSVASQRLEEFVRKVAPTDATVLLTGESGTGKTEIAKLIHSLSSRAQRPLVTVYCTTLSESLLESELFGHVKGSFTGATHDKMGKLEAAQGGTLFLDEVGDLTPNGQAKLLRFLQDKVYERVGSNETHSVDARILAATNKDLLEEVKAGRFREDLYYRLNVFECCLVPLRHRKEDIPILIEHMSREILDFHPLPQPILDALSHYSWPGNLRELRNTLERITLLSRGRESQWGDLPASLTQRETTPIAESQSLEEVEKRHIQSVLALQPNLEKAADSLGITTVTLWRKRKQYGIR